MATKSTKTTKKSTKTVATSTAKRSTAKKSAGRAACKTTKACKIDEASFGHRCFCAALCVCCAITAMMAAALFIGIKASDDALAKDLAADREMPSAVFEGEEDDDVE